MLPSVLLCLRSQALGSMLWPPASGSMHAQGGLTLYIKPVLPPKLSTHNCWVAGSMHALVASPFKSAYNAAKHGIAGFTKTAALEVGRGWAGDTLEGWVHSRRWHSLRGCTWGWQPPHSLLAQHRLSRHVQPCRLCKADCLVR